MSAPSRRFASQANLVRLGLMALTAFLFVYPVAMLVAGIFRSARPGRKGDWTLEPLMDVLSSGGTWTALSNSLIFALLSTLFALLIGLALAFVSARTDAPLRRLITPAMVLLFAAPHMLYAVAWTLLADPVGGVLNDFAALIGLKLQLNIYSWTGLVLVQALKMSGFCYLMLVPALVNMNRSFEEASLIAGASRLTCFLTIDLPLLLPALTGVAIITMVFGLGAFDAPQIIGVLPGIPVLSTEIYKKLNYAFPPDYAGASALGLFLILALIVLLLIQWRLLQGKSHVTVTGKAFRNEAWEIGAWRWPTAAFTAVVLIIAIVLPLVQLVITSFQPSVGVYKFTLVNFERVLADPQLARAFRITGIIAVFGGLTAMLLSAILAFAARRAPRWFAGFVDAATMVPIVMPGIVLAVGLLWAYIALPGLRLLYGSFWFAFIGLVILVMPIASRAVQGAISQIAADLEEAASVSGASRTRIFSDILLPLIRGGFLAGWLVTAVIAAGTLDIPLMLLPPNSPNVAVLAYGYMNSALMSQTSAVLVLLMAAVAAAGLTFWLLIAVAARLQRPTERTTQ